MSSLESVPKEISPDKRNLFKGPDGLRAGWRLAIFILLTGLTLWLGFFLVSPLLKHIGPSRAGGLMIAETTLFLGALIPTAIMSRFEQRPMGVYGLPMRSAFRSDFWRGAAWGFINLSLVMLCMMVVHAYSPGGFDLAPFQILKFGLLWAVAFLLVGFAEEYLFRGYMLYTLTLGMGFWPAAIILSIFFALAHRGNPGETWMGLLGIVVIAIFFCLTLQRTGTLWFAVGLHMSYDWGESFFYSVPDSGTYIKGHLFHAQLSGPRWLSGGSVGPEASLLAFIADLAMLFLFVWLYRQKKYPLLAPVRMTSVNTERPPDTTL
jgi:membrane protease YdiL (CAAX protease family)